MDGDVLRDFCVLIFCDVCVRIGRVDLLVWCCVKHIITVRCWKSMMYVVESHGCVGKTYHTK